MTRNYLGQGIKYPHEIDELGKIELQNDIQLVRQSIRRILQTKKGSVYMNRGFGSYVDELMFEQNDAILFSLLDTLIADAISEWEKRVRGLSTDIEIDPNDSSKINVRLSYEILSSNEIDSFIWPFYRELKF